MSKQGELNSYIRQLHRRLRLRASLRGVAILTAAALATTFVLVLTLNAFAFPIHSLTGARAILLLVLALAATFGLGLPLMRLNRRRSIAKAEAARPAFQQRLVTFSEREKLGNEPFIELLAADTLAVAQDASPSSLVPDKKLFALAGAGIACAGVLVWMIAAGPGYLGYGASLLWAGQKRAPLYDIQVTPGNAAVRRNGDQLVTAKVIGLQVDNARLYARYQDAVSQLGQAARWEPVAMQPQSHGSGFQFLFAGLPQNVEYYVQAGPLTSRHFKIRVVDLPSVKQIQVTYRYPKWTGLRQVSEEHGGDLRAIEGTTAELQVRMDRPLRDGLLVLDSGEQIRLTGGQGNVYKGSIPMHKDGSYHVAAFDHGQQVRLSEDYFIATDKANPPEIAIVRPGGDYRASPIEEVTIGVKAADEFGLRDVAFHYSVNGGPDKSIDLLKKPGVKSLDGSTTLSLEDFKLVPGDLVSIYATAKDGHSEAHSDIAFIQADPFERDFSQSQQSGGGGGGGQGQNGQPDIARRQKELIAETWKYQNNKSTPPKEAAGEGKFLSDAQSKLREQALALAARMQSRDLSGANEAFGSFTQDMQAAAGQMAPSAQKLKQHAWRDAIPTEQKALEYLLRAEATFRQIEVAFGRGGGGGGGGSAGRDLAGLFDLELDTQKNQYETAQTGSPQDQRAQAVDDALKKLDDLAHRQEALAQQHNTAQTFQERWQQEMLRREAEQLQRQLEQMAQNNSQGQPGGQSASGSSGQQSSNGQPGGQPGSSQSGTSQSQLSRAGSSSSQAQRGAGGTSDPRITQALNRLREAEQEMKHGAGQQQGSDAAQRAADQLRQATQLMGGAQHQEASSKLGSLSQEADRLNKEEHAQASEIHNLSAQHGASTSGQSGESIEQRVQRLAKERQQLADNLTQLESGLRDTARGLAPSQPATSSKLRDALSAMDQADLANRVQRTADWLRRGIDPNSNGTEAAIGNGLQRLSDQVRQAEQSMGAGQPSQGPSQGQAQGQETAALNHVERLRSQIESMTATGRNGQGRQPGQQGKNGQGGQSGQQGQGSQQGQGGQEGQLTRGGRQGQQGQGGQQAQGSQPGQIGRAGQRGGGMPSRGPAGAEIGGRSGDVGNGTPGGGGQGTVVFNVNTGDNHFDRSGHPVAPDNSPIPAGAERAYHDGLAELGQLRGLTQSDPEALKQVQDLVRQMQHLDPKRFPGNPALVEQLHTQVLSDVDKLELQLRRDTGSDAEGQVRTDGPAPIPPGYQDAVAEYFRRLGKGQ